MLETDEISRNQEFVELNQTSLRDLRHFLKTYTNGLRVDQPLAHVLHRLQFVVPCASSFLAAMCKTLSAVEAWILIEKHAIPSDVSAQACTVCMARCLVRDAEALTMYL